ncbi:hypothetical protein ACP275_02G031100 [Erythranthe tilingii]
METEVMAPSSPTATPSAGAAAEFNFDSTCTTPYISASSSPQRFPTTFYSLPASPTRISAFYHQFHDGAAGADDSMSSIPFHWEEKPGTPKSAAAISSTASSNYGDADQELNDADFAFDFSGHLDMSSLPADELFDGGRIKPLKPPPRFLYDQNRPLDSPKSPKSPKNFIIEAFSPRRNRPDDFDPFAAAIDQTRKEKLQDNRIDKRGREHSRTTNNNKGSRSVSPLRVSDLLFDNDDDDDEHEQQQQQPTKTNPPLLSSFSSFWYKKWRIKDLLLFRSASESRAKDQDELKKYHMLRKPPLPPLPPAAEAAPPPQQEEVKNSSFRSTESVGSVSSRRRSSGPAISAHELHYTVNRALSEEMRKRTTLPYKRGFLGCLGFHPTVSEMSKGIAPMSAGSSSRG